jgi:hypothetical protein
MIMEGVVGLRYVALYIGSVVAANLTVASFGPGWSVVNALLFVGLDLTTRDRLHDKWRGKGWRMTLLIAAGGALSWLLNANAAQIAIASTIAFSAAGVTDWVVYSVLKHQPRMQRVNGSNIASAAVDSLLFPTIAFGVLMPMVVLGQFAAKVIGGFVWALILR